MDRAQLQELVEEHQLSQEQVTSHSQAIHEGILAASPFMEAANFTSFHADDIQRLFEMYDRRFFEGLCRRLAGGARLAFRISGRMTRAGGKTTRRSRRNEPTHISYEIAVSSTLLFQTFRDGESERRVTGLVCRDRLDALQRIMEHELVHLIELILWDRSSCSAARFQSIAARFFGHTDHRHELVTPRERALTEFGVKPGGTVRFHLEGFEYVGVVNRITKRATVLVEDTRGEEYSDGKRYAKFYVPVGALEPIG